MPAAPSSTQPAQPATTTPSSIRTQAERTRAPVSDTPTPDPPPAAASQVDKPGGFRVGWILVGAGVVGLGAFALWVIRGTRRSQGGQG
jgi:uncharacterized protein HemX